MCRYDNGNAVVTFAVEGKIRLGSQTSAHIRTGTMLGQRVLTLESAGNARMPPGAVHSGESDIVRRTR